MVARSRDSCPKWRETCSGGREVVGTMTAARISRRLSTITNRSVGDSWMLLVTRTSGTTMRY